MLIAFFQRGTGLTPDFDQGGFGEGDKTRRDEASGMNGQENVMEDFSIFCYFYLESGPERKM